MKKSDNYPVVSEQMQHLKEAKSFPFKKRMRYYFDFFKMPALYTLLGIFAAILLVKSLFFQPHIIFNGSFMNAMPLTVTDEEFLKPFCTYASFDAKKSKFLFTPTDYFSADDYNVNTKLLANVAAGESDFFVCNETDLLALADYGFFEDVTLLIPESQLSSFKDRLFYYDYTSNDIEDDDNYGNIPVAIRITDSPILKECGSYDYEDAGDIYFCFACNSKRVDNTILFLHWLMGMPAPATSQSGD